MIQVFSLREIVNMRVLQEIQDKFCEATGLAAVIVDVDGKPVTNPSNFTTFCKYLRENGQGLKRCMACDDMAGRRSMQQGLPIVYRCHSGLTDLAAPIIVNNVYMGAFLAGQILLQEDTFDSELEMTERLCDLNLDIHYLRDHFNRIEYMPRKRVQAAADLVYILSNYIVEMGVVNITQKQLMTEMKAKAELENLLRAAELKALQSQVNPHFMFNTLNTIARLALLEGAERTQEVVYALSDLLRNHLRDNEQMSTLEAEIKGVSAYLLIQKARFGDRIKTEINVPAELGQYIVPVMILQPLVENSIIHGLEKKPEGGSITISAGLEGDSLVITVVDTGVGIPKERMKELLQKEKRTTGNSHSTGLGIINVHKRIQHHFGQEYGLNIISEAGKGTTVYIKLPNPSSNLNI